MTWTVFTLLALFGIKHFLADFVLQFPYMIREKGIYGAEGGLHHAALHSAFTLCILVLVVRDANTAILLAVADGIIHYHIDWIKQKLNQGLTTADRMFWVWLGADQTAHYLTYIAIISCVTL